MRTKVSWIDVVVLVLVALLALGLWLVPLMRQHGQMSVRITSTADGTTRLFSLDDSREIDYSSGDVRIVVCMDKSGVWIKESSCPDKICLHTGKISHPGESIVCVPAGLLIEIVGGETDYVIG